jgi:hypothetical protein
VVTRCTVSVYWTHTDSGSSTPVQYVTAHPFNITHIHVKYVSSVYLVRHRLQINHLFVIVVLFGSVGQTNEAAHATAATAHRQFSLFSTSQTTDKSFVCNCRIVWVCRADKWSSSRYSCYSPQTVQSTASVIPCAAPNNTTIAKHTLLIHDALQFIVNKRIPPKTTGRVQPKLVAHWQLQAQCLSLGAVPRSPQRRHQYITQFMFPHHCPSLGRERTLACIWHFQLAGLKDCRGWACWCNGGKSKSPPPLRQSATSPLQTILFNSTNL